MVKKQNGFTLIEIVIVVVLLGAIAAIAVPHFAGAKNKAYQSAMSADLRTAAMLEEQYAADNHGQYFSGRATHDSPLNGFTPSKDVTVTFTAFNILAASSAIGSPSRGTVSRQRTARCAVASSPAPTSRD